MNSKPWETLPGDSRFWCFSAAAPWPSSQDALVDAHLDALCATWAAHGAPVTAGFTTVERRIIALAVDERGHAASGCSIDSRMKQLQVLGDALGIDLFGRMHVYVRPDAQSPWELLSLSEARRANGEFLNTVAPCKGDWQTIQAIEGSWMRPKRG